MEENNIDSYKPSTRSRVGSGIVFIIAGIFLLAYKLGAPIPSWLFTWPMILILIGLLNGVKHGFRNAGFYLLTMLGTVFLIDQNMPGMNLQNYLLPIILITLGALFILKPKKDHTCNNFGKGRKNRYQNAAANSQEPTVNSHYFIKDPKKDNPESISIQAVFGGIKRNVLSKNFKGGDIVSFMGGSEINFSQADIQHPIELEIHNVFGGTKLVVPSNWDLKNTISVVFGGVEDKRVFNTGSMPDPDKQIILKGSCVFGGIEISNY